LAVQLVDPVSSSESFFYNVFIRLLSTSSGRNPLSIGAFADLRESIEKVDRFFTDCPPGKINKYKNEINVRMDGWVKSKHRVKTLLVKHTNLANEKKGSGLLLLSAWSTNQVEQRSAFLSRLMPNLLNRCQLWLKCWSELWNQAEAGLLAIPSLVLLLPSRNSNDRRLLELLLLLLSSRRPPDFFTRLEQLISGRSSLEHYGFNCLSPLPPPPPAPDF
jgi:hypothetical protein